MGLRSLLTNATVVALTGWADRCRERERERERDSERERERAIVDEHQREVTVIRTETFFLSRSSFLQM